MQVGKLLVICAVWFVLWSLTPGLLKSDPLRALVPDEAIVLLVESVLVLILALVLLRVQRRYTRRLFARSPWALALALPAALLVAAPFHYEQTLPLPLYVFWIGVSVFWQDFTTFGLLQSRLMEQLPQVAVVPIVGILFYVGHAVLIPERFAPVAVVPSLLILGLGAILSVLRARTRTLHLVLALHLSFYLVVI